MKRDAINYTLVGGVVLFAVALLLVGVFVITGRSGRTETYFVQYRNVTGLDFGAPVFYEGYRIGQVEEIEPQRRDNKTSYRVQVAIRRDWSIPDDSLAQLAASGLLADVAIAIREGKSPVMLKPGGMLKGREAADVFNALNELAGEVTSLTRDQVTPLVRTLTKRIESISGTIDDNAPEIVRQARDLLVRLNRVADGVENIVGPDNRRAVDATLKNLAEVTGELKGTQEKLDSAISEIEGAAVENRPALREAVQDMAQITSALSRRIDAIANNLEHASRNVNEFSREIRKSPNRLLRTPPADDVVVEEE